MSQAAKAQEPSMEEILASIRRIIADDESKPAAKAPEPAPAPAPPAVAAKPAPAPTPAAAAPPPEPEAMSQDDIDAMLAGFDTAPAEAPEPVIEEEPAEENDVLDLTEAMEAPPEAVAGFRKIEASQDIVFSEPKFDPPPRPEPPAARFAPPEMFEPVRASAEPLLSDEANAAAASHFGSLAHTVLAQNARTLDDLVREMLRPMLKNWLDDNLPTIVERLVRAEIERVSRGRG
jgi:cell pole-organizing protein PopZ